MIWVWQPIAVFSDFGLSEVEKNKNYDFKQVIDKHQDIYNNSHICEYIEPEQLSNISPLKYFSIYSHNVRSINAHFIDLKDNLENISPHTFSILALQEIWSVNRNFDIPGYSKLEYNTRDKHLPQPNPNCGGGVGFLYQ